MSGLSKGEKWLARAMVPGFVGVAALCYLAWRPCEPVAQAATAKPIVVDVPEFVVFADDPVPTVSVEDLPKAKQGSRKGMAGVSKQPTMACTPASPEWHCWNQTMLQGTVGHLDVQACDCSKH